MNSIKRKHTINLYLYSAIFHGQGVVAAPKAYFAKQSMERVRRVTAKSPVFAAGKNGQKIQVKENEKLLERHPYPRDPAGVSAFYEKLYRASCLPNYRIVVDNKDPADCK